jgi:DNA polymerase/3'-5' exonuclease PolX
VSRQTWPLHIADVVSHRLSTRFAPACARIEVAGSIRRREARVGDIELVAEPRQLPTDLFGAVDVEAPTEIDAVIAELGPEVLRLREMTGPAKKVVRRSGARFKALEVATRGAGWIPVDLFIVLPPAQWGAILAIRTGPRDMSARLVTSCQRRGLVCIDGRLVQVRGEREVPTPSEEEFFAACGVPWAEPEDRR